MVCSRCGAEVRGDRQFCTRCGGRLGSACSACGAALEADDAFCGGCGAVAERGGSGAPTPGQAARTERRLVSVLFCDLVGFTTLSERRDPEEVRELLSSYFDGCREVVESYGGAIEKFIGDAVMAVWGTPQANEDDAERAVRAALDLVDMVAALGTRAEAPGLGARAGVLTGEAVVNLGVQGQGMVAGDVVNTASRLQSVAEPGTVVVGEGTFRAAAAAIAFAELGDVQLKGKSEEVRVWRALRVVAQRRGGGAGERPEPPFTGRAEEIRQLKDILQATGRERRPTLVSITGVPGIGKSRLVWELQKYVDGVAETIFWHQGRCPSYGQGVAFWALGEMVRMRCGIAESEVPETAMPKLAALVHDFFPDDQEAEWITPRLAHLLGLDEAPSGGREELYSAWRSFFEGISQRGTSVLVFEDLQWADSGLIDFVESILEWSRTFPIMVVTLSRPELSERRPTWGAHQRNFVSLHLDPLSEQAMDTLLRGFVQGLPDQVLGRLRDRAEGIPLYAVETVRALVDRGILVQSEGGYRVVGDVSALDVPESLHALIASRLDALPPAQRGLLQDASILGKTFTVSALAAVSGSDPTAAETALRDLVRKELLSVDADPRSPERGHYGFVQGLIREVAYGTIARRDRVAKHLAAAQFFERMGEEELSGVVAGHYLEAHLVAPPGAEADEIAMKAREGLIQAGKRAKSVGSTEEALGYFERALEVPGSASEQALLHELVGQAASDADRLELALEHHQAAIAGHRDAGDEVAAARTTARLVGTLRFLDRYSEAVELGQAAFQALGADGDPEVKGELAGELASVFGAAGESNEELRWAETMLSLAGQVEAPTLLVRGLLERSFATFQLGRQAEAAALCRTAGELAQAGVSLADRSQIGLFLGLAMVTDDPRQAAGEWLEAAALARRGGLRAREVVLLLNAAESAVYAGDWSVPDRVLPELQEREMSEHWRAFREAVGAILLALRGETAAARQRLGAWSSMIGDSPFLPGRMTHLNARAMIALASGDLDEALRKTREGIALDPGGSNSAYTFLISARAGLWLRDSAWPREVLVQMAAFRGRFGKALRHTVEAGILALDGASEAALATYREALSLWRALDLPLPLALCELDMALLLGLDHTPVREAADEARQIFEELGARPFLELLPVPEPGPAEAAAVR